MIARLLAWWPLPALAALLALAWALAARLPTPPPTVYARVVAELPPNPPAAEVSAAVFLALGVRLSAEDVAAWRAFSARGDDPAQALRAVVDYRRAIGGPK